MSMHKVGEVLHILSSNYPAIGYHSARLKFYSEVLYILKLHSIHVILTFNGLQRETHRTLWFY
jgi:hypothetical protein